MFFVLLLLIAMPLICQKGKASRLIARGVIAIIVKGERQIRVLHWLNKSLLERILIYSSSLCDFFPPLLSNYPFLLLISLFRFRWVFFLFLGTRLLKNEVSFLKGGYGCIRLLVIKQMIPLKKKT